VETCRDCGGAAMSEGHCVAHLPDERRADILRPGRTSLDARGVSIGAELLAEILAAEPQSVRFDGAEFTDDADFPSARFVGDASFQGATFVGKAEFAGAVFEGAANFADATFAGDASFARAVFHADAKFSSIRSRRQTGFNYARFLGYADFARATFDGECHEDGRFGGGGLFNEATFAGVADFTNASFSGQGWFPFARFAREAWFNEATFTGHAFFGGARFEDLASFFDVSFTGTNALNSVRFEHDAVFRSASFSGRTSFAETRFAGPAIFEQPTIVGTFSLESAVFESAVTMEVSAAHFRCTRARFAEGAHLRVRHAPVAPEIALGGAEFGGPSIVEGAASYTDFQEGRRAELLSEDGGEDRLPRVVTVRLANVGNLVLSGVDLRACLFAGAHSLDGLRLENVVPFAPTPSGRRWTRRRAIAEEHEWRSRRGPSEGWSPPECRRPDWLQDEPGLAPAQTAAVYRALRKGREDNKDEPGAADFYYGEMEMRRHDAAAPRSERVILWLYWLLSGYALRGSRAFLALLIAVVLSGLAFDAWGFDEETGAGDALLFSAGTSVRVASARDHALSSAGDALHIALGIVGPVLLGLALLSIRGRVKR
jgi:Pentapeptide repeats (9 copies)